MDEPDDQALLAQYARTQSETAFAALVTRHVNLVYAAAWRFTGNRSHAEEITQAVFIILARKAARLPRATVLAGWLYQTARLTAANFMKGEGRRQRREQEAIMESTANGPEAAAWERIEPLLDEAMGQLGQADRDAVVLRYFQNKTAREIAAVLRVNEAAAHKRVARALGKLRDYFGKRGVRLTDALLAGALVSGSALAAPAGLTAAATLAAAVPGALLPASLGTLVKGTMNTMAWLKLKFAAGLGLGALVVVGALAGARSQTSAPVTPAYPALAEYLTNHVWLAEFTGSISLNRYRPVAEPGMETDSLLYDYEALAVWRAGLQPGGFYLDTDNGFGLGYRMVFGENAHEYWQIGRNDSLAIAPKAPAPGGTENNGRAMVVRQQKQALANLLNLGIDGLDTRHIQWVSSNQFESPFLDTEGRPAAGRLRVTVEQAKAGLPVRLRAQAADARNSYVSTIHCAYAQPALPPSQVIVEKQINGEARPAITNWIEKAVFGLLIGPSQGYGFTNFMELPPTEIIVWSNNVRYSSADGVNFHPVRGDLAAAERERNQAAAQAKRETSPAEAPVK
jgi:RNA polymerase sigma factor (sigma-70 family)